MGKSDKEANDKNVDFFMHFSDPTEPERKMGIVLHGFWIAVSIQMIHASGTTSTRTAIAGIHEYVLQRCAASPQDFSCYIMVKCWVVVILYHKVKPKLTRVLQRRFPMLTRTDGRRKLAQELANYRKKAFQRHSGLKDEWEKEAENAVSGPPTTEAQREAEVASKFYSGVPNLLEGPMKQLYLDLVYEIELPE